MMRTDPVPGSRVNSRAWLRVLVVALFLAALVYPVYEFFSLRGGVTFLRGMDYRSANLALFPLLGLLAFSLVWAQVIIGSAQSVLRKVFPNIIAWHRRQGVFVLLFALLHPTMRYIGLGFGVAAYFQHFNAGVAPSKILFLWFGYVQLFLMLITAGAALLRRAPWLVRRWHAIHYANYGVFVLVWLHSWFLGTDVQSTGLRYLWIFFAVSAAAGAAVRLTEMSRTRARTAAAGKGDRYVAVANTDDVKEGVPFCGAAAGKRIALFRVSGTYYALDNACSHAGASLCEGTLEGTAIRCPLHSSRFDVRTGGVIAGPATMPQRTYDVRVREGRVEIRV